MYCVTRVMLFCYYSIPRCLFPDHATCHSSTHLLFSIPLTLLSLPSDVQLTWSPQHSQSCRCVRHTDCGAEPATFHRVTASACHVSRLFLNHATCHRSTHFLFSVTLTFLSPPPGMYVSFLAAILGCVLLKSSFRFSILILPPPGL